MAGKNCWIASITGALFIALVAGCAGTATQQAPHKKAETTMFKKATPILFVDDVQHSVDFFLGIGFEKTISIPYEHGLQFAAVETDGVEIMFQASDVDDPTFTPEEMRARVGQGFIYFEITDFDKIIKAIGDAHIVKNAHETPYGAKEIYIREPGGNVLGFAKQAE